MFSKILRSHSKGFSLVELLVVVAIIGVLAAVGIVGYDRYVENAKMKVFEQNVQTILKAIDFEYTVVSNVYPQAVLGVVLLDADIVILIEPTPDDTTASLPFNNSKLDLTVSAIHPNSSKVKE